MGGEFCLSSPQATSVVPPCETKSHCLHCVRSLLMRGSFSGGGGEARRYTGSGGGACGRVARTISAQQTRPHNKHQTVATSSHRPKTSSAISLVQYWRQAPTCC